MTIESTESINELVSTLMEQNARIESQLAETKAQIDTLVELCEKVGVAFESARQNPILRQFMKNYGVDV